MILGPFSARPPSVELIDQEPATRRQATVMKFNLTRRNARFQGETPTSICIACETSPRVLSRRPAGTTRCESSSKARWLACGRGSVGRASPCQGEGRGFESRRPLPQAESRQMDAGALVVSEHHAPSCAVPRAAPLIAAPRARKGGCAHACPLPWHSLRSRNVPVAGLRHGILALRHRCDQLAMSGP